MDALLVCSQDGTPNADVLLYHFVQMVEEEEREEKERLKEEEKDRLHKEAEEKDSRGGR